MTPGPGASGSSRSPHRARSSQPASRAVPSGAVPTGGERRSIHPLVSVRDEDALAAREQVMREGAVTRDNVVSRDGITKVNATAASIQHKKNWRSLKFSIRNDDIPPEYDVTRFPLPNPYELMWAALGVLITAAGALLQITVPDAWTIGIGPIQLAGYRFSFQLAGLLVTAFMGGARAALLSQLAYLGMGLAGFDIFMDGGGAAYIQRPAFGYLIGFIPGAWLCGRLAEMEHRTKPAHLFTAGLCGLLAVHVTGIIYLMLQPLQQQLWQTLLQYSAYTALGQLIVLGVCVALSVVLRAALLY
ncbi:MAG: biotin transporter BioY [Cyanobacteria bacterium P01_G01_bin.4]